MTTEYDHPEQTAQVTFNFYFKKMELIWVSPIRTKYWINH